MVEDTLNRRIFQQNFKILMDHGASHTLERIEGATYYHIGVGKEGCLYGVDIVASEDGTAGDGHKLGVGDMTGKNRRGPEVTLVNQ